MATRIEEINVALTDREARMGAMETMFAKPDQFDDPTQLAASGEEYRVLKEEAESLWGRVGAVVAGIRGTLTDCWRD